MSFVEDKTTAHDSVVPEPAASVEAREDYEFVEHSRHSELKASTESTLKDHLSEENDEDDEDVPPLVQVDDEEVWEKKDEVKDAPQETEALAEAAEAKLPEVSTTIVTEEPTTIETEEPTAIAIEQSTTISTDDVQKSLTEKEAKVEPDEKDAVESSQSSTTATEPNITVETTTVKEENVFSTATEEEVKKPASTAPQSSKSTKQNDPYGFKKVPVVRRDQQKQTKSMPGFDGFPNDFSFWHDFFNFPARMAASAPSQQRTSAPRHQQTPTTSRHQHATSQHAPCQQRTSMPCQQRASMPCQQRASASCQQSASAPSQAKPAKKPVTITISVDGVPMTRQVVGDKDLHFNIQTKEAEYQAQIARLEHQLRLREFDEEQAYRRQQFLASMVQPRPNLYSERYYTRPAVYFY